MKDKLIYIYLYCRSIIKNIINKFINTYFKVSSVKSINGEKIIDITYRYYLIEYIDYVINFLVNIRNSFDKNNYKLHANIRNINKTIILDKDHTNCDVTLHYLANKINYELNKSNESKIRKGHVYTKLELVYDNNDKLCLKKYVEMYNDDNMECHHTIKNIMTFNMIKYDPDAVICIEYFKDGSFIKKEYKVIDVYNSHINQVLQ